MKEDRWAVTIADKMVNETLPMLLALTRDVNFGGKVHGGAVMKWVDLAAYACSADGVVNIVLPPTQVVFDSLRQSM